VDEWEMRKHSIALIGFRATGKSLISRHLAEKLGLELVDMDEELVARLGQDISTWVGKHGWESFRDAESELLTNLSRRKRLVLDTGGGIVLRAANRKMLKECFLVVWLKAAPETIHSRLVLDPKTSSNRPPLTGLSLEEEIQRVLEQRFPLYRETADLDLVTEEKSLPDLVSFVQAFWEKHNEDES
jgi:shikimate kinase